ncbi:hypothetical protein M5689_005015 [Euphorbia peplus]|nr:hypothetical protein M5689_005015 [Euphorbia peplus]
MASGFSSSPFSFGSSASGASTPAFPFSSSPSPATATATSPSPFSLGSSPSPFGSTTTGSAFSFGSSPLTTSTANPASSFGFNAASNANPSSSSFGFNAASSTANPSSGFGFSSAAPATSFSFGSASGTATGAASGSSLFGAPVAPPSAGAASSPFGNVSSGSNLFGSAAATNSTTPFGAVVASPAAATTGLSLFGTGSSSTQPAASSPSPLFGSGSSLFGATTVPSSTSLFGIPSPAVNSGSSTANSGPLLFGTPSPALNSGSSLFGSSGAATTITASTTSAASPPGFTSNLFTSNTSLNLNSSSASSPFSSTSSGFNFTKTAVSSPAPAAAPSAVPSSSAASSGFSFSMPSSAPSQPSFSFSNAASSSAPSQPSFSFSNAASSSAPAASATIAAKTTSPSPLFSTVTTTSAPTPTAAPTVASSATGSSFSIPGFQSSSSASASTTSAPVSSFTGFGGASTTAASGNVSSFTGFSLSTKSTPASTSQTQSTTTSPSFGMFAKQPLRDNFLAVQGTRKMKKKKKKKAPIDHFFGGAEEVPRPKACAKNLEQSLPRYEVPTKSFGAVGEASQSAPRPPSPTYGKGRKRKMAYSHAAYLPMGFPLHDIPLPWMHQLGEKVTFEHPEVLNNLRQFCRIPGEREKFKRKTPLDISSKAFGDCATVLSSLAELDAHIMYLSEYKEQYVILKAEMEMNAIAWKGREKFLVQVNDKFSDEKKALLSSIQSFESLNQKLVGLCKQQESQIIHLDKKLRDKSEEVCLKEKEFAQKVKEKELQGIRRLTQLKTSMINEMIRQYPEVNVEALKRVYPPEDDEEASELDKSFDDKLECSQAADEPQGAENVAKDI